MEEDFALYRVHHEDEVADVGDETKEQDHVSEDEMQSYVDELVEGTGATEKATDQNEITTVAMRKAAIVTYFIIFDKAEVQEQEPEKSFTTNLKAHVDIQESKVADIFDAEVAVLAIDIEVVVVAAMQVIT